jgi:ParB family transcriptional regulator, chromosome partitioning protein
VNIPINRILPNPDQPRKVFDKGNLEALAQSIREIGVIQDITVEEGENGYFILVDGERRLRAAKLAGLKEMPASIRSHSNGSGKRLVQALVANVQREDLNPIEEAQAYQRLQQEFGLTIDQIALKTGKYRKRIDDRLLLLKLDEPIQELVAKDLLSKDPRVAKSLLCISQKHARVETAKRIAQHQVKVTSALRICEQVKTALETRGEIFIKDPPSISIAKTRYRRREKLPNWNILRQLGKVPPWEVVTNAATETCNECGLRPVASKEECGACPAVELIKLMLERGTP